MADQVKVKIQSLSDSTKDVVAWFKRYELACKIRMWVKTEKEDPRLDYLPVFLEDSVLLAFDEFPQERKATYEVAKQSLIERFDRKPRVAYEDFVTARLQQGTTVDSFIDQLKKSIQRAVASLPEEAVEDLVLHQFLLAVPVDKREQILLATEKEGEKLKLGAVVEKARSISFWHASPSIPVATSSPPVSAALGFRKGTEKGSSGGPLEDKKRRCFNCNRWGHLAAACPSPKKTKNGRAGAAMAGSQ